MVLIHDYNSLYCACLYCSSLSITEAFTSISSPTIASLLTVTRSTPATSSTFTTSSTSTTDSTTVLNGGMFKCNDGTTISTTLLCNQENNCSGGEDEANCGKFLHFSFIFIS